ncbi:MAG TPA: restriction endonuclease subunit S, partial [Anaerolineales bacterium]|nr:restriction endonuclease subunit S [Anaerolineales bacterium]
RFLSAKHISKNGVLEIEKAPFISTEFAKTLRIGKAKAGDVFLANNATVGPVAKTPEECDDFIVGTSLTVFRSDNVRLSSDYVFFALQAGDFQIQLFDAMKQTTRNQVPITKQRLLSLPIPNFDEQIRIAKYLNEKFPKAFELMDSLESQLAEIKRLPASLLREAFAGRLSP